MGETSVGVAIRMMYLSKMTSPNRAVIKITMACLFSNEVYNRRLSILAFWMADHSLFLLSFTLSSSLQAPFSNFNILLTHHSNPYSQLPFLLWILWILQKNFFLRKRAHAHYFTAYSAKMAKERSGSGTSSQGSLESTLHGSVLANIVTGCAGHPSVSSSDKDRVSAS